MATSKAAITEGSGLNVATRSFTEDAVTKHDQRVNIDDTTGADALGLVDAAPAANTLLGRLKAIADAITGTVAHDAPDTTNPASIGGMAKSFGTNPTGVADGDKTRGYYTRAGQMLVIGGHPNVIARSNRITDADGAQTDAALVSAAGGVKIVITQIWVKADKNNSGNVAVKIGFGTANVPTPTLAGVAGLIFDEDFGAGEGHQIGNGSGIVAVGADGEDLRITCDDPAGGQLTVGYSYFTIEG